MEDSKSIMILFLLGTIFVNEVCSYNVETNRFIVELKSNEGQSLFGYSLSLPQQASKNRNLLVGAPSAERNGVTSGVVYSCNIDTKKCTQVQPPVNGSTDQRRPDGFFGVSLASVDGETMIGGSRWFGSQKDLLGRVTLLKKDYSVELESAPCESLPTSFVGFGYCMAGFSSAGRKTNDQSVFVTGTPGALKFSGALFTMLNNKFQLVLNKDSLQPNTLMGYSTAVGIFSDPNEYGYITDVVGGAPKGNGLAGRVTIYKITNLTKPVEVVSISGPSDEIGSYYGSSIAAVDLNNDGKDDLLVGSPLYSKIQDEGRVYVYINRPGTSFNGFDRTLSLEGDNEHGARFGSSIANIGDINNDGFKDVAIGAPYGGADGNGAVYIYNGGLSGLKSNSPQKILASDMPTFGQGFGISIAGGVDVDNNGYPDLVVGSYKSDAVFVIKTRPLITIESALYSSVHAVPNQLNGEFKCPATNPSLKSYNCVKLLLRLMYGGKSVPDVLDIEYAVDVDVSKIKKRATFLDGSTQMKKKIRLTRDSEEMIELPVAIKTTGELDWVSPIEFISRYEMIEDRSLCRDSPCAMLDTQQRALFDQHQIVYSRHCQSAASCSPDLKITSKLKTPRNENAQKVVYGRDDRISLLAKVKNTGEPAYQSQMNISFHNDLDVIGVYVNQKLTTWKKKEVKNGMEIEFFLQNPISPNTVVDVEAKFSLPSLYRPTSSRYTFQAQVSAFGTDPTLSNNAVTHSIDVGVESCMRVAAEVKPPQLQYLLNVPPPPSPSPPNTPLNESVSTKEIGTQAKYTFIVKNNGNVQVGNMKAKMTVPIKNKGVDFVYVASIAVDGVVCNTDFNEKKYATEVSQEKEGNGGSNNLQKSKNRRQLQRREAENSQVCADPTDCKTYSCEIDHVNPNEGSVITIVTRLWDRNLPNIKPSGVKVFVNLQFTGPEKSVYEQRGECNMESYVTLTLERSLQRVQAKPIPWWIIFLAVVGALLILGILIFLLVKCGFFKRNRVKKEEADAGLTERSQLKNIDEEDEE